LKNQNTQIQLLVRTQTLFLKKSELILGKPENIQLKDYPESNVQKKNQKAESNPCNKPSAFNSSTLLLSSD